MDRSASSKDQASMPKVPINRRNVGPQNNLPVERESRFIPDERRASKSVNM